MSYLRLAVSSAFWNIALRVFLRLGNLIRLGFLARIFTPFHFGLISITFLVLAFLEILTETGINVFLLQQSDSDWIEFINSAWVISLVRGLSVAACIALFSPFVSSFFHSPQAQPLLYLVAAVPFVRGFINPACIGFQKRIQIKKEFIYKTWLAAVEITAVIAGALVFRSISMAIWGMIVASVVEVVASWLIFAPRPKFAFSFSQIRYIISRGKWVTGLGLFDYIFSTADNVFIGRVLGPAPLGLYQNSYKLSTAPLTEVNDIIYKTTFPIFARMRSQQRSPVAASIPTAFISIAISLFISSGLFFFAHPLVIFLLGPAWLSAVPLVRALAFLGLTRNLAFSFNSLFLALGLQKYVTVVTFAAMFGLLATIWPLVNRYGTLGAAYSALLGSALALPFSLYFILKTIKTYGTAS